MYFNDVNIGYYILVSILGLFVGEFVNWANIRLADGKKVFEKGAFIEYKKQFNPNYFLMILTAIAYVAILYRYGFAETFIGNLDLIKYFLLTPMLLSALIIDYKVQIIPNRLNLIIFEIGLIFAFIYGLSNIAISLNMLLGMLAGGGIFLGITFIGWFVYGKETMGLGDVKLMGALGLCFGLTNIITIALISFLIGAVLSIFLILFRIKKINEYIPFGPFIVIAVFVVIFVPYNVLTTVLYNVFTLGLYNKMS